ncbi:probable proton-coupled zinc antiporter SLC30A4 [Ylistrum balloti]|uniref:probable proton-coupled zinc antiporter SLC30A4 n=1 Tax=Ylistrum balloti TaxID=509963 RepID=UPI002905CB2C|nr:probable proton-coupled zinc antiporter SLC30A4 [Ylistrum balloti]
MAASVFVDDSSGWDVSDINSLTAEGSSEQYTIGLRNERSIRPKTGVSHKTTVHSVSNSSLEQHEDVNKHESEIGPFVSAASSEHIDSDFSADPYIQEGQRIDTALLDRNNRTWPFEVATYPPNDNNLSSIGNNIQTTPRLQFPSEVSIQQNTHQDLRSMSEDSLLAILEEFDATDINKLDLELNMIPETDMTQSKRVLENFKRAHGTISNHVPNGHLKSDNVSDKIRVDNLHMNERPDESQSETHVRNNNRTLRSFSSDDDLEADLGMSSYAVNGTRSNSEISEWHCHTLVKPEYDKLARNQLIAVCVLCALFMIGEAVGGVLSDSLALFTDVLHLGSDLISFLISLLAIYLSKKPATKNMSFGYHRAEVLGALFSVFIIWLVTGVLCYMAVERITGGHYTSVKPDEMLVTASLGVMFNVVMGIVLHSEKCCGSASARASFGHGHSHGGGGHSHGHSHKPSNHPNDAAYERLLQHDTDQELMPRTPSTESHTIHKHHRKKNINVRAAFIHVIGDIIQSVGVLVAALIIKLMPDPSSKLADPICTFLFSIIVLFTTVFVLRDTLQIMMEGVPRDVDYSEIIADLESLPGVKTAHDLSVWALTIDKNAVAIHLGIDASSSHQSVLEAANTMLKQKHKFLFTTVQVETHVPEITENCHKCQVSLA